MKDHEGKEYYKFLEPTFLKELDQILNTGKDIMIPEFGQELADELISEVYQEFEKLIPDIPYIGGDDNPFTVNLVESAQFLAFYKVLQRKGIGIEESGALSPKIDKAWMDDMHRSGNVAIALREESSYEEKVKAWARISQKRLYPEDWVYEFLEGDGKDFDSGVDMLECGILKFYQEHGMADFVPYLCAMDIPLSVARKHGLHRTQTLSEGGNKCDFRLKNGRPTKVRSTVWNDNLTSDEKV